MSSKNPIGTALCSLILTMWPFGISLAGLGGDASSVEADRASVKGALRVTPEANFAVHEITTPNGMQIHEYLSSAGKVFAVSWRGPGIPDLRQMLAGYYGEYAQAASAPHYNHHHLNIETPHLIVQSSGHTRAFFGRAWVPALLPRNFSLEEIH